MPVSVIVGLALLVTSLGLRRATINRHIRGRLFLSAVLFAAYTVSAGSLHWLSVPDDTRQTLEAVNRLLIVFGVINLVVALTINPWRVDRIPDRFPNIVQDTIVIALFALVATLFLRERVMATTAVGAVVIGFALQDTLGNLFAGLAIQIEKPFRVGHWVTIGGQDGMVSEITWRATKMRTQGGQFRRRAEQRAREGHDHQLLRADAIAAAAGRSRRQLRGAAERREGGHPRGAAERARDPRTSRAPEVLLVDFGDSAIVYRVRFWVDRLRGRRAREGSVRSLIYYAFRRNSITIPYPIQVEMSPKREASAPVRSAVRPTRSRTVALFSSLADGERAAAAVRSQGRCCTRAGEAIVRQGEPAGRCSSSFAARRRSRSPARRAKWRGCERGDFSARCRC